MPNKAKLVTRSTATSSVTTDNLNKGSALEFAELDSSLINLRDQTFGIVADDSSTIDVGAGDTLYIQGGTNVTTSTNSDGSITINSTASGGATNAFSTIAVAGQDNVVADASTDTLTLAAGSNMTITTNASNDTITFASSGSGNTIKDDTSVNLDFSKSTGTTSNTTGSDTTITGASDHDLIYKTTGSGSFQVVDSTSNVGLTITDSGTATGGSRAGKYNAIVAGGTNNDLVLSGTGTGAVLIPGDLNVDVIRPEAAGNDIHILGLDVDSSNRSYVKVEGGSSAGVWIKGPSEISMDHSDTIGSGGVFHSNEIFTTFNKGKNDIQNFIIRHHQSTDSGGNTTSALFHLETYADRGTTNGGGMITIGDSAIALNGSSGKYEGSGTELFNVLGTVRLDQLYIQDNKIYTNTSNSDLDLEANGSGKIKISGLKYPNADGSAGQFLKTDGSGNLSFATAGAAALTGSTNNTITTVTGANAIQGEANLTFDGTTLATTGSITATNNISSEAIQLVDNVISASRSNDSLFIEPAGTGIISLGNATIDGYSSNARWKNGVLRVFEDLAFDADSQTSSSDRKYLHTTISNIKFNGDNHSNSNARWRNSYNILQLDMNSSELTPSGTDRITGLIGEVDVLNSDTSTAGRLSHSAGVWGVNYLFGAGDLTVNNVNGVIATNFVESSSGKTITVDQSTGFRYNGTSKDGGGTDVITTEIGFLCAGPMNGTTKFAFKDETNGQSLFGDVLINQNTISTNSSNADLEINANGSGTVVLENLSVAGDGATVTGILDEDDMSSNSNTKLATQQSIKAYVDAQDANIASDTLTLTNKTIDANGTGNNISNIDIGNMTAAVIVTESEGIGSNDNDTTIPTSAAVKDYVDNNAGGGVSLSGSTNNTIATVTGSNALAGEANLTFDGSTLAVTGAATISTTLGVTGASTLDGVTITDNHISSNRSNDSLHIEANGTGQVELGEPFDNIRTSTRYDFGVNKAYVNSSYDGATRIKANNEGIKATLTQTTSSTNFQLEAENRTELEMAGFSLTSSNAIRGLRSKSYNTVVNNSTSSTASTIGQVNPISGNVTLTTSNGNITGTDVSNFRATLEGEPSSGKTSTFTTSYNYWGSGPEDLGEGGTTAGTNYYGLYIDTGSLATNNYGVWINNDAYINKLGGVTLQNGTVSTDGISLVDNEITATRSNDNLEISANGTGTLSLSSDGTFSDQITDTWLDNFGSISRNRGVHIFRIETIGSALTSSSDRRQGHLIGQQYTLGNYSSSDKDNRYRAQTVGCAVDLNGATVNSTNSFAGAMGAQGQAAVQNRDASNAGTIGNVIGVMGGAYFYSPQTVNITNAHGVFSYVEQDDGGGTVTLTNGFAYKAQINKYAGTMTNGYAYYIDSNGATNKYGFYDTTNSLSRFGAVQLDNQAGDPTHGADKSFIYAKDESSSSEVFVKDEAGNVTKISPHNTQGEWEYYSRNTKTGKTVRVNMERMIKKLEELTGETFIESV